MYIFYVRQRREILLHLVRVQAPARAHCRLRNRRIGFQRGTYCCGKRVDEGFRRIAQHQFHRHLVAIDADAFYRAASDEVLAGVWIDNAREQVLDLLLGELRHENLRQV